MIVFLLQKTKYLLLTVLALILFMCAIPAKANTKVTIDLYKTNQITAKEIRKKFGKKIKKIAQFMSPQRTIHASEHSQIGKLWMEVISGIQSMGDFAYVKISPIFYLENEGDHVTIDIVDKKDQHRLSYFLPKPNESLPDPDHLIKKWSIYEKTGLSITFQKKDLTKIGECPAHHCLYGFEHKELKRYEDIFNHLVPKNKKRLATILKKDKDEYKRAAASFLLAHLKNPQEVIRVLSPSVFDSSPKVRNAVMRVMAETLRRKKETNFSVKIALIAMDFPSTTDRNKALSIIKVLAEKPVYQNYLKKHARFSLIAHLKMSQPVLHDPAYEILKKISGKNFSDHDYASWEQWANSAPAQVF